MKAMLMLVVLVIAVSAVYPLLVGASIAVDMLAGDGTAYHYIFSSTNLRLTTDDVLKDWVESLVIAVPVVVVAFSMMLATHEYRVPRGLKYVLSFSGLLGAFALGGYVGGDVLTGVLYVICSALVGVAVYIAMRLHVGRHRDV